MFGAAPHFVRVSGADEVMSAPLRATTHGEKKAAAEAGGEEEGGGASLLGCATSRH